MSERLSRRSPLGKVDRYLRREDTALAQGIRAVCSLTGAEYRTSKQRRAFELTLAMPMAAFSIPASAMLGVLVKTEDGNSMLFTPERVGKDGKPVRVNKLRTMRLGSESAESYNAHAGKYTDDDDPRVTKVGRQLRRLGLDELPQIAQVLTGELSLIDVRCVSPHAVAEMQRVRPETFDAWYRAYMQGKPGIANLYSAVHTPPKSVKRKAHVDLLYAKKASLGLDLYILFRLGVKGARKLKGRTKATD